ncbi:MAG: thioredoxin domain-containing protein [Proteobacteria bacterium]|nr:thioredoxin domain-containing protein [Pseudomonadota bacterium]
MKKLLILLAATTALTACNQETSQKTESLTEEQVKLIIDNYIEENPGKIFNALNIHMNKLQTESKQKTLEDKLKNPVSFKLDKDTPIRGAKDAIVTVVEFSDYECPFCGKAKPTLNALLKRYKGKIKFAYQHLPLPFHGNANSAALASIAAHKQGKFWEFHDELFKNQTKLSEAFYLKTAKNLGLDMAKFKVDMASKESKAKLAKDLKQAQEMGIGGTPNFLINGVAVEGALPEAEFVKIIEKIIDNIKQ